MHCTITVGDDVYVCVNQSITQSIKTFARAPVTDDHWRRTSNPIKSIVKNRITN